MNEREQKRRDAATRTEPVRPEAPEVSRAADGAVPAPGPAADRPAVTPSSDTEIADFLAHLTTLPKATAAGPGRLIFAMDATMSRQPTWDLALGLQSDMFEAVRDVGGLHVQLVYFRGAGECRASRWVADAAALARLMRTVQCEGGYTQMAKVLGHARDETQKARVSAIVYVGDAMEEDIDALCGRAGELALLGVPMFLFQEGRDPAASVAFRELARITKGAHCRFDRTSAAELRALLAAVAVYAAGGRAALGRLAGSGTGSARGARLLIEKMRG
jgi:hypothetical protein